MKYRRDFRSAKQFKADIKESTDIERQILTRWLDIIEKETGSRPHYSDNGCDNSGEFLPDKLVTLDPDYVVEGVGPVEIKFSYPYLQDFFHLKVDQIVSYIKDKAALLFVNGWDTPKPEYCLISYVTLAYLCRDAQEVSWHGFGNKPAYRLDVNNSRLTWKPFSA